MEYIKVKPIQGYTSKQRCEEMNKELWGISRPSNIKLSTDVTSKLFGELELLDGSYALEIDQEHVITVHKDLSITGLSNLFPDLTEVERNKLISFIENSTSFPFKDIIPSGTTVYTFEQLVEQQLLTPSSEI